MSRMVRKQVYIEREQEALLKRAAAELGVTVSELIRRGIEQVAPLPEQPGDERAWEDELTFIRARERISGASAKRTWTRDDLHGRRKGRVQH